MYCCCRISIILAGSYGLDPVLQGPQRTLTASKDTSADNLCGHTNCLHSNISSTQRVHGCPDCHMSSMNRCLVNSNSILFRWHPLEGRSSNIVMNKHAHMA